MLSTGLASQHNVISQPHPLETDVVNVSFMRFWQRFLFLKDMRHHMAQRHAWYAIRSCKSSHNRFVVRSFFEDSDLDDQIKEATRTHGFLPTVYTLDAVFLKALHTLHHTPLNTIPYIFVLRHEHIVDASSHTIRDDITDYSILCCYYHGVLLFQRRFHQDDLEREWPQSTTYLERLIASRRLPAVSYHSDDDTSSIPLFVFHHQNHTPRSLHANTCVHIPYTLDHIVHLGLQRIDPKGQFHAPSPFKEALFLTYIKRWTLRALIPIAAGVCLVSLGLPYIFDDSHAQELAQSIDTTHKATPAFEGEKELRLYLHKHHTQPFGPSFFKTVAPLLNKMQPHVIHYQKTEQGALMKHRLSISMKRPHMMESKKDTITQSLASTNTPYHITFSHNTMVFDSQINEQGSMI